MKVTVIGTGAWGSTLADLLHDYHHEVVRWSRRSAQSFEEAVLQSQVWVSAISMKGVREMAQQAQQLSTRYSWDEITLVSATKGLDAGLNDAGLDLGSNTPFTPPLLSQLALPTRPSEIWNQALPQTSIVVLSGPNLSKEIQQGLPAASVVASQCATAATHIQQLFNSHRFRVYTNADPIGVELAGALKNVIAIATGACDGLCLGVNARSALITRGLTEMIRIANYWGAQPETLYGLAGVGDLMATCSSPLSRNYQVGYRLAQGESIASILLTLEGTAEGLNTAQVLIQLATRAQIDLPITQQVHQLIQGQVTPADALNALMSRVSKSEKSGA